MAKPERQASILEVVRSTRVSSQEALRELLHSRGFDVTQATLSRDIRELRLVKVPGGQGDSSYYRLPDESENKPPIQALLPLVYLSGEGTGSLLVVRTVSGSAQAAAIAIDGEDWPEVLGTVAGDDTIFLAHRSVADRVTVERRLAEIAGNDVVGADEKS
jgi:transcriptional regulator of arginine metabolism